MCGFAGFLGGAALFGSGRAAQIATAMRECIRHRGPDHGGLWLDAEAAIAFAHRRLAIVDLSAAGDQPMHSVSGRYVTVYNGEIYNHLDLRRQLEEEGHRFEWRGHSDTETLLAAIDVWGVRGALQRSIGMFALALWDRRERLLILARDRLGEKPLYYGWQGEGPGATFLFGSELKALRRHPAFAGDIDRDSLTLLMRYAYVPAPHSIYRGIRKLMPGCIATLRAGTREPEIEAYWSAAEVAVQGVRQPFEAGPEEAVESLERLLMDAIGQQMIADVPLGAFLSGGVDSSTVVALMQAQSARPVKTFSIGFHEAEYNEATHAKAVAEHLGTDHTELYVTPAEAMQVIPQLPEMYDEPFADSSQIPTYLVSRLARRNVTVSLSGDAGDELFAGYNRYAMTSAYWRRLSMLPRPLRGTLAGALTSVSPRAWNRLAGAVGPILPNSLRMRMPGDKIHKGAGVLKSADVAEVYHGLVSNWRDPEALVVGGREPPTLLTGKAPDLAGLSEIERMMALDMITYLPDDILAKVDRAAMSVSLETRVPLLDHRVVEFAWRLPSEYKIRDGQTKWALREVLYRHVPRSLIERPKMGFGIPVGDWLRGPMRAWAEALLDPDRLAREGYFRPDAIRRMWQAHLQRDVNEQYRLWIVLMFQAWLEAERAGADLSVEPAPRAVA
ncbi:MAG TPA: asparagine synthase (glutamine-hydrolyzing) [Allosphingosinicella sp.]|jgi:asparagine synthase (glutamine-hydrolysing)